MAALALPRSRLFYMGEVLMAAEPFLAFAGYRLDPRKRLLIGPDGRPVDISSRAFDTLYYLASHPQELIDKPRLMKAVWPNSVVEENNLNQQISALRRILGDTAGEHRFIVTVPRHGYRFVQPVQQVDSLPAPPAIEPSSRHRWRASWRHVAVAIVGALMLVLGPSRTRSVEAYEAYLAARAELNNGGSAQARAAIGLLERAVQLDPDFALAWAALAESYTFVADYPPSLASNAALRAFELAPDAPQTLRSAAMVSMQNRDWAEAERRLRKAVALAGPHDYDSNQLYAWFLMNVGRVSDAIPYQQRAVRAQPQLLRPVVVLAALHEMRGDFAAAEALLRKSKGFEGNEVLRRQGLIMVSIARDDRPELRRLLTPAGETRCETLDDPELALAQLYQNYADATSHGARGRLVPVAIFASFLGDKALSLDALRGLGSSQNLHALWRPVHREVRQLPEFRQLVQELGLVDYWRASGNWGDFCQAAAAGGITCR